MRGDRGGNVGPSRKYEIHRLAGRHVLDHDAKPREAAGDVGEDGLEKHALAIENVHAWSRNFPVNEQGQVVFLHRIERGIGALDARDSGSRVRRRAGRIVLHPAYEARSLRARDLLGARAVSQIEGHEGLEI